MTLISLLKFVHLVGLVAGLGGALLADAMLFQQAILKPIRKRTIVFTRLLSRLVLAGLAILWVSGLALVWVHAGLENDYLANQKVWAKVAIVSLLTANAIAVHAMVLPMLSARAGRRLFDIDRPGFMTALSFVGAVSVVSWFAPFFLGVASELNFTTPATKILTGYAIAVLAAWFAVSLVNHWATSRRVPPARRIRLTLRQRFLLFVFGLLPDHSAAKAGR